jgi:hypothetical protein
MSNAGGKRVGAGRKPGSPNLKTMHIAMAALGNGLTPVEYMLQIMRDIEESPERRLDAARSVAPYIHPRLSSVEAKVETTNHEAALNELV